MNGADNRRRQATSRTSSTIRLMLSSSLALFGNILRYDHRRERFLIWNSHRWQPDNNGKVFRLAIEAARARYQDATNIQDLKGARTNIELGNLFRESLTIEAAISIAKNLEPITDTGENWDREPVVVGRAEWSR